MDRLLGVMAVAWLGLFVSAANAQGGSDSVATLTVDKGVVMVSTGGVYASAASGQSLVAGERVMITQDGAATVRYGNGCTRTFTAPGVYAIDAQCTSPAAGGGWSAPQVAAAVVAGSIAAYEVVHNITHDEQQQPISR